MVPAMMSPAPLINRLWAGVLLVNLLMAAVVGVTLKQSLDQYGEKARAARDNYALILAGNLSSVMSKVDLTLLAATEEASRMLSRSVLDGPRLNAYLEKRYKIIPELDSLRYANALGVVEYGAGTVPTAKISIADRDYFVRLQTDPGAGLAVSKATIGRTTNTWVVMFARRVNNADGSFGGLIYAAVTLEYISQKVFSQVNIGSKGLITLWDGEYTIVVRYPDTGSFGAAIGQKALMPAFLALQRSGADTGHFEGINLRDKIVREYSFRKIPGYPFSITVGLAPDDYLADWRRDALFLAGMASLFVAITLVSAVAIHRSWRRRDVAVQALTQQEEKFRSLVESTDDMIWETDQSGRFTYVSPRSLDLLGYEPEEMLGRSVPDFAASSEKGRLLALFEQASGGMASVRSAETVMRRKDGAAVLFETSWVPFFDPEGRFKGVRGIDRDVTERTRLQEMLVQSEKMVSVGGLAAGMAHEINNPLSGILQSVQVIQRRIEQDSAANEQAAAQAACPFDAVRHFLEIREVPMLLAAIRESASRAAHIVSDMLEFSRKSTSARQPADLSGIMEKALALCLNDYDLNKKYDFKSIRIERRYAPGVPPVACVPTQIEQVVMNLLRNTAQAMAGAAGGDTEPVITLRTSLEGENVRMEVEDNGPGMDEETRRRIFEPFFTTKSPGKGTGLGLSVSYFIITKNHGGTIQVESEPGRGTKFIIRLPLNAPDSADPAVPPGEPWAATDPAG
ncbi:ATP-binding protein [Fundidesulfovibrio terrae]|uniref:ATP-binding protein n=1 Tax=Fundidesulfovibrio terrae TaxID=2922866 RepID=UPI001FAFE8F5|nr:ATP-binding protein [Fundidesulfovibrio terrae]